MATNQLRAFSEKGNHEVGNLSNLKVKTVNHGAIAEVDTDNFLAVELGFNAEGERTFKPLSDVTKKTYLVAAPETRYMGEEMVDFFIGKGERVRIVVLEPAYTRFDTSAFTGTPENGKVAHFDPETKKYIIHDGTHEAYATASAKYLVVSNEEDLDYTLGKEVVKLEVIEA